MRAAVFTVALFLAPALVLPQSLGDAARKQARDRSKQPSPRVYTETDLHGKEDGAASAEPDRPAPATPAGAQAGTATPGPEGTSEGAVRAQLDREADARNKRERAWRGLARAALARLSEAQRGYDAACGSSSVVLKGG